MTKILRHARNEDGMALVLAVGFLAVISVVAATMISYTSSNSRSASFHKSRDVSEQYAEAGIARALSVLANAPNATAPTNLPGATENFSIDNVYYSGILAGETWNITSVSSVKNPAGGSDLHKTLTAQVQIGIDPAGNNAWNYVYSDAPSSRPCLTLSNSVNIQAPFFVKGNVCLQNSAKLTGNLIKVGGTIDVQGSGSSVGTSTTYAPDVRVAGGCRDDNGSFNLPCTTNDKVYATTFSTVPGQLEKPAIDLSYWYSYAKPGPTTTCTSSTGTIPSWATGSWSRVFDSNTTMDRSLGNIDFMTSSAYSCTVWNGPHLLGKIAWTPDDGDADTFGSLEILGTVFFDGNLDLTANRQAIYTGRGTIYASGWIDFGTSRQICGVAACDIDDWDAEANLLVFVSGNCNDTVTPNWPDCVEADQNGAKGFEIGQSSVFQGAVYAVGDFTSTSTAQMQGPVIAHQLDFEQSGVANKWVAIEAMTMGTPGGGRKLNVLNIGGY
jgi:Tfp pilus assembly protein PilX